MNEEEILYQIVAVDSEFKKGFPDKITTIFKNGITGKTYTDYDFKNHRYLYTFINDNFNIYDRLKEKDNEIERLNNIIDTMLEFSFFKEECPLNFGFADEKEEKAQDVIYEDDYCEENCNDIYKKCWLKYFEKLQELKEDK